MSAAMTRLDNWVMDAGTHEREEARDALRFISESDLVAHCQHPPHRVVSRGPYGICSICGERVDA